MAEYDRADHLPHNTLQLANTVTERGDVPDSDYVPVGIRDRFEALVGVLHGLETRRDIDVLDVLLAVERASDLSTEDLKRAVSRERKLKRSNADEERNGGRPSKVDRLAQSIGSSITVADRGDFDTETRDEQIEETLRDADISRRTYYRLRDHVRDDFDFDISNVVSPVDVV